jgi:glycosyltransferase involved in cell wall biosynthesis
MTRVAMFTPLPPARTGVAHYASMIIPALRAAGVDLEVIASATEQPSHSATRLYHLGNNPHHEWIYREAMQHPGVIVLHDLVLHHLIVEMTLARGDADGYAAALAASHGAAGEAWARGRAAGLHSEMGNFLLPASVDVANRSLAVIVHNRYAADRLASLGVTAPIHVVPHPYEPHRDARARRGEIRARYGFSDADRVIGFFGFLTSAKRAEVVLAAFERARERDSRLKLLIVGEAAPNIDVATAGYVPDEEFPAYFAAVDRLVNLRYPTAGETSGTLIRAFEAGKPVAVSDYAQFAELPDDCAVKIPFGDREGETLAEFFRRDLSDSSAAQRRWLDENASMEKTVEGYSHVIASVSERSGGRGGAPPARPGASLTLGVTASVPLFPQLEAHRQDHVVVLTNRGAVTLRARSEYHLVMQVIEGGRVTLDRWLQLPGDLAPGETTTVPLPDMQGTLRLFHAIYDVPEIDPQPFAVMELRSAAV